MSVSSFGALLAVCCLLFVVRDGDGPGGLPVTRTLAARGQGQG